MSDLYTDAENAVLDLLQGDSGLDGIQTWEADLRECLFAGDKLSQGFRTGELPAVNVAADREPVTSEPFTHGEIGYTVPITVVVVDKAQTKKAARAQVREYVRVIENLLHRARQSGSALLPNSLVNGQVSSDVAVVEEKPYHFAVGEVRAQVFIVRDL